MASSNGLQSQEKDGGLFVPFYSLLFFSFSLCETVLVVLKPPHPLHLSDKTSRSLATRGQESGAKDSFQDHHGSRIQMGRVRACFMGVS